MMTFWHIVKGLSVRNQKSQFNNQKKTSEHFLNLCSVFKKGIVPTNQGDLRYSLFYLRNLKGSGLCANKTILLWVYAALV